MRKCRRFLIAVAVLVMATLGCGVITPGPTVVETVVVIATTTAVHTPTATPVVVKETVVVTATPGHTDTPEPATATATLRPAAPVTPIPQCRVLSPDGDNLAGLGFEAELDTDGLCRVSAGPSFEDGRLWYDGTGNWGWTPGEMTASYVVVARWEGDPNAGSGGGEGTPTRAVPIPPTPEKS